MPSMDGVKTTFLREERKDRAGMGGTLAMEGVKEMKGTSVAYQQKAATAKESYERDHDATRRKTKPLRGRQQTPVNNKTKISFRNNEGGWGSSSGEPTTAAAARGTRGSIRRVGGTTTSGRTNDARGYSGSDSSGSRSGRSTPSETVQPADEDDDDPLDTICHTAEEDGPCSKRRTRPTTTAMKARLDKVESGVAGPASRTRRAPTPLTVKPPAMALLRLEHL
ncbi:hypothetical protein BKA82DRAFT_11338 [Pisolithus tinctorius]|uniref:Uncharacterized protein n=1 Tax=Pisolithus tinctorius Marx 270 TaxID=870435 RepID=A0A0C3NE88_PISTI|nr:hypothetical protein BKA82DRAFT_11338 [Pisolithus tinctorius]KIN94095.1 hypothetical protein M404DRAFT_11338 [Pisolithus tinctorius Marx 270]